MTDERTIRGGRLGDPLWRAYLIRRVQGKAQRNFWIDLSASDSEALGTATHRLQRSGLLISSDRWHLPPEAWAVVLDAALDVGMTGGKAVESRDLALRSSVQTTIVMGVVQVWRWHPDEPLHDLAPHRCNYGGHVGLPRFSRDVAYCRACRYYASPLPAYRIEYGTTYRELTGVWWSRRTIFGHRPQVVQGDFFPLVVGEPLWDPKADPLGRRQRDAGGSP